jgi:hypothetical protein
MSKNNSGFLYIFFVFLAFWRLAFHSLFSSLPPRAQHEAPPLDGRHRSVLEAEQEPAGQELLEDDNDDASFFGVVDRHQQIVINAAAAAASSHAPPSNPPSLPWRGPGRSPGLRQVRFD